MVEKDKSKINPWVLGITLVILFGIVIYFAVIYKGDLPGTDKPKAKVYVTSVELDKIELTININESTKLIAKISPSDATNKTVTWISNNESVVSVDEFGNIKGLSVGKATITVKTDDGKRTASCIIEVIDPNEEPIENKIDVIGVNLNNTDLAMLKGNNYQLIAKVIPTDATNQNVTWTSSDESVATVDETGKVTAIEVGKATIIVKTKDGGKAAKCNIKVMDKSIPVTGVALSKLEMNITKGSSETLGLTIVPNNATNQSVTWSSSNTNIVKVDSNGTITGVDTGKATITVKTKDGNKTAKCVVTVSNVQIDVTDISLSETELEISAGSSKKLNVTITPSNATNKYIKWTSSNYEVAKVDSTGLVTAVDVGKATITAQSADGKKIAKCVVTVPRP